MKVDKKNQVMTEDRSIPGLVECEFKYKITSATGDIKWVGPKIPPEVWYAVTSYFKWCYDLYHSECQVRLYVSPTLNTWKAWAYPQEAKTGMTAREIDNDLKREQNAQFQYPEWIAMGTVHHHCSAGAFQSGTDQHDEEDVDGLHITVGNLNDKQYSLHARFYRKGLKVDPDMGWFFDVGNFLDTIPEWCQSYLPKDIVDKHARRLMCTPVTADIPQLWKDNIIEIKAPIISIPVSSPCTVSGSGSNYSSEYLPAWQRANNAWKEIIYHAVMSPQKLVAADIADAIQDFGMEKFAYRIIIDAMSHHKIDYEDLIRQQDNTVEQLQIRMNNKQKELEEQHERFLKEKEKESPQPGDTLTSKDIQSMTDEEWAAWTGQA